MVARHKGISIFDAYGFGGKDGGIVVKKICGSSMLQWNYGLYTEVQDDLWRNRGASVLQRTGKSSENCTRRFGGFRSGSRKITT